MTEEEFHNKIYKIVKKYFDEPQKCFSKLQELQYPNSNHYVQLEHAKFFYEKYAKLNNEMEIDENFTKNAYDLNSKIFKNAHCKKK